MHIQNLFIFAICLRFISIFEFFNSALRPSGHFWRAIKYLSGYFFFFLMLRFSFLPIDWQTFNQTNRTKSNQIEWNQTHSPTKWRVCDFGGKCGLLSSLGGFHSIWECDFRRLLMTSQLLQIVTKFRWNATKNNLFNAFKLICCPFVRLEKYALLWMSFIMFHFECGEPLSLSICPLWVFKWP